MNGKTRGKYIINKNCSMPHYKLSERLAIIRAINDRSEDADSKIEHIFLLSVAIALIILAFSVLLLGVCTTIEVMK